jgi:hypothetical protein
LVILDIKEEVKMNYPSDKNKEQSRKLYYGHRYLVYDMGYGEQGAEERYSIYRYYICTGYSEYEIVEDYIRQSPFTKEDIKQVNGRWFICDGRSWLKFVRLVDGSDEKEEPILKW